MRCRTDNRLWRVPVWLVAAAVVVAASGRADTTAQTTGSSISDSRGQDARDGVTPAVTPLVLEFDLPAGFAQNGGEVTDFRVGFFRGSGSTLRTIDVSRDEVTVSGRTARLSVARAAVPACSGDCTVRVQTLSRARASAWSEPVPLSGPSVRQSRIEPQPPQARPQAAAPAEPPEKAPARPRFVTPDAVQKYELLSAMLRKLLPTDAEFDAEIRRFRRLDDLALAAVVSRDFDIPFTTLTKQMAGPPRMTVRNALRQLRKDFSGRAFRKSRAQASLLLRLPETKENAR